LKPISTHICIASLIEYSISVQISTHSNRPLK
jgi:hypothetical protein